MIDYGRKDAAGSADICAIAALCMQKRREKCGAGKEGNRYRNILPLGASDGGVANIAVGTSIDALNCFSIGNFLVEKTTITYKRE